LTCLDPSAIASATAVRDRRLCPLRNASQYGNAADIPPATGANPRAALRGLTHTIRKASRRRRPSPSPRPRDRPAPIRRTGAPTALARERWLIGPAELDPTTATGRFFARHELRPPDLAAYASQSAAIAAAAAGEGVLLALTHSALDELRRRALIRLDVRGTPVLELWHASTLGLGHALPAALALQRFACTPEATQAISSGRAGRLASRARPAVHVTLWRSVAAGLDAAKRPLP
jgi:hypothetical protein